MPLLNLSLAKTSIAKATSLLSRPLAHHQSRLIATTVPSPFTQQDKQRSRNTVYVKNISFRATPEDVGLHFQQYGAVDSVSCPRRKTDGLPAGYAFVDFERAEDAADCLAKASGTTFMGREVVVETPKERGGAR